jgi:hypothetical protein
MRKIFLAVLALISFAGVSVAQNLPAGSLGAVTSNTPNTWQSFSYTFTPSTSGANFLGFAFRQDPAFWTFDNVRLTAAGSSTNLLTNGAFDTGGQFSVTTNNGPSSMQAPTNWGVWYQNGTYPAAAGTWTDIGGTHGGVWYDGAVGSFDGIYQGVTLQAGTTYTVTFDVSGNQTANTSSIQLGVYGGACASVSIAASQCTIPASVGFTTLATPEQGSAAGNPTPPPVTLVSTTNLTPTVSSSTAYGTATTVNRVVDAGSNRGGWIRIDRSITPLTTRPFTTTTVTTPRTLATYSDNSTVTTNGTPVTTTTLGSTLTVGQTTVQSESASSEALKNALSYRNFNPFVVDALSTKDGPWAEPKVGIVHSSGNMKVGGIGFGYQKTNDNNTFGIAGYFEDVQSSKYLNSALTSDSYSTSVYWLSKQNYGWFKTSIGYGRSNYESSTNLPTLALGNSNKLAQNNFYADLTIYSAKEYAGIRPLVGVTINRSNLTSIQEFGSMMLSTIPEEKSKTEIRPYAGLRYQVNRGFSVEGRVTHSQDYRTVGQLRARYDKQITERTSAFVSVGGDIGGNGYRGVVGQVGLTVKF